MFALPSTVDGIVIPSTINSIVDGVKTTRKATKAEIARNSEQVELFLCQQFGGCTVTQQTGLWYDEQTGKVIREKSLFIWAYSTATDYHADTLRTMAEIIAHNMHQDSVLYVVNSQPYLT